MKLKQRTACPVCASASFSPFMEGSVDPQNLKTEDFKITDSRYGSRWSFQQCDHCSFVFSNPCLHEDAVVEFYSQLEDQEYSSEAEGRGKNFKAILKRMSTIPTPDSTLLDIGAASGIFMNEALGLGYDVTGLEPSEFLVKEAKRLYGLNIEQGTIENLDDSRTFSTITCLDIIEHLVEPDDFMKRVSRVIKPGGLLVVVTPDIGSLASRLAGKRWWHYRIAHLNFFNLRSLKHLLEKHGFEIVKKKRYTWNFSAFYLATRIFPSLNNKKALQTFLKKINFKLQFFDSWEIYAAKKN